MKPRVLSLVALLAAAAVFWALRERLPVAAPGVVFDEVYLFSDQSVAQVETYHEHLLKNFDIDFRVHAVAGGDDINMLSARRFKELGVGALSASGRGVLFTVNTEQDRVRVEISAGLEGIFTDAFVSYIERNMMVPYFRSNMVAEGIMAATELFVSRAQESGEGISFDAGKMKSYTAGAGAVTDARIGAGQESRVPVKPGTVVPQGASRSPQATFEALLAMLSRKQLVYDPLMFTRESVAFFSNRPSPPAAAALMYKTYSACTVDAQKISGGHAVLRFRPEDRKCGPFFFKLEEGMWKFDLIAVRDYIIYDFQNQWMLKHSQDMPYYFGFDDWPMQRGKKYLIPKL